MISDQSGRVKIAIFQTSSGAISEVRRDSEIKEREWHSSTVFGGKNLERVAHCRLSATMFVPFPFLNHRYYVPYLHLQIMAVMLIQCSNLLEKLNWCGWFPVSKCT